MELSLALEGELVKRGLVRGTLLYQANATFVYSAIYSSNRVHVAVKVQGNLSVTDCGITKREYENQMALPQHPNVVQLYDYFYFESPQRRYVFVIIIEYLDKDIQKEITYRNRNAYPWTSEELIEVAKMLIEVLALLQQRGIAHRDIKPQNLFVDTAHCPKLGDFGSSRDISTYSDAEYSITGTPFYMSPELKKLLMDGYRGKAVYNPIKSDVYSLGLTLLTMYKLTPPTSMSNLDTLKTATETELQLVQDSTLRQLLIMMLAVNSNERPDFLQLAGYLRNGGQEIHYTVSVLPKTCEHVMKGVPVFFNYPCHGQFCRECIPAVSFLGYMGEQPWYQFKCPQCLTGYEASCDDVPKAESAKMLDVVEEKEETQGREDREEVALQAISIFDSNNTLSPTEERKTLSGEEICKDCLWCKQPVDTSIIRNPSEAVLVLNCLHKFCSQKCFLNFFDFASNQYCNLDVKCPACSLPITLALTEEFHGGTYLYQKAVESRVILTRLCGVCKANLGTQQLHETHWYCTDCFNFLAQPKLARCVSCSDCLTTLQLSYSRGETKRTSTRSSMNLQQPTCCLCFGGGRKIRSKRKSTLKKKQEVESSQETDDGTVAFCRERGDMT